MAALLYLSAPLVLGLDLGLTVSIPVLLYTFRILTVVVDTDN